MQCCFSDAILISSNVQSNFQRLLIKIVAILSWLHFLIRSSLEIVLGQKMHRILLKLLVWKYWLFESFSVILQHSDPYSRVDSTQLWYSFILVVLLYYDDFHTLFSVLNTFLALFNLFMSFPAPPSFLTVLPM